MRMYVHIFYGYDGRMKEKESSLAVRTKSFHFVASRKGFEAKFIGFFLTKRKKGRIENE